MATVDSLDIQISSSAKSAVSSIDKLIGKIGTLSTALSKINTGRIASEFEKLSKSAQGINANALKSFSESAQNAETSMNKLAKEAGKEIKTKATFDVSDFQKATEELGKKFADAGKGIEFSGTLSQLEKQYQKLNVELDKLSEKEQKIISIGRTSPSSPAFENLQYDISLTLNKLDTLSNKIKELESEKKEITITGLDKTAESAIDIEPETVQVSRESLRFNASLMREVFGEGAENIRNWGQAVSEFGENAGATLNNFSTNTNTAKDKISEFESLLNQLEIPPINETNLTKLRDSLSKTESKLDELRTKLANELNIGHITEDVDDKGFVKLQEQIKLTELRAEALKDKIQEVETTSKNTSKFSKLSNIAKNIGDDFSKLANNAKKIPSRLLNIGSSAGNATNAINKMNVGFKNLLKAILPFLGIAQLFKWGKQAMEASSDLTEVQNVVDVAFGDMADKVEEFSKTSIQDFGMSELTAKQISGRFQAMGTAIGFSQGKMSDMAVELTKLSADMASFYNVEQEDVAKSLQSVFTGTTAPLRKYGIDLTQATLQEWLNKQGIDAKVKSMSRAEKTMLRYQYVMANTAAAQGDFARTSDTWANQTRILKQNLEALAGVIGGTLINALKPFVKAMNVAMGYITAFAKTVSNALGKIFGWTYEEGDGGITSDFEDAADASDDIADSTGKTAKNTKKTKDNLRSFDELKTISLPDNEDSGTTGGIGSALEGLGEAASGKWQESDNILKQFESDIDTLYKLGEHISKSLQKAMESIDWDSVYEKARGFGGGLAEFLNGVVDDPNLFKDIGITIAGSINTVLNAADAFAGKFHFYQLGEGVGEAVYSALVNIDWNVALSAASNWGSGIAKALNGFISPETFGEVGKSLAMSLNTAVQFALDFGTEFNFANLGNSIGTGINDFVKTLKFKELAQTINTWIKGALKAASKLLKKTDFKKIGEKIGEFLAGLDFSGILKEIATTIWEAIKGAFSLLSGIFKSAPLEASLIAAFAFLKLTGLGKVVATNIASAIGSSIESAMVNSGFATSLKTGLTKIVGSAVIAFAEFSVVSGAFENLTKGTGDFIAEIGKIAGAVGIAGAAMTAVLGFPAGLIATALAGLVGALWGVAEATQEAFEQKEIELYGDTISNTLEQIQSSADETMTKISESKEKVEDAGEAEAKMAKELADRYFDLSEKQSLTNDERAEMKGLAQELIGQYPDLEKYYNSETGLLDTQRQTVDELIDSKLREIKLSAIQEEITEMYKNQRDALKNVQQAMEATNTSKEEMIKLQEEYDDLQERMEKLGAYEKLKNELAYATDNADELQKQTEELWNELTNNGQNREFADYDTLIRKMAFVSADIETAESNYASFVESLKVSKSAYDEVTQSINELQDEYIHGMADAAAEGESAYAEELENNDTMEQATIKKTDELIKEFESGGKDCGKGYAESLKATSGDVSDAAKSTRDEALKALEAKREAIKKGEDLGAGYEEGISGFDSILWDIGLKAAEAALGGVAEGQDSNSPSKEAKKLGEYLSEGYSLGIEEKKRDVLDSSKNLAGDILSKLSINTEDLGKNIIDGMDSGMSEKVRGFITNVGNIAGKVVETIKNKLEIHSPSRVMFELGDYTMQGFQEGIESLYQPILSSVKEFGGGLQIAPAPNLSDMYANYQYQADAYTKPYGISEYTQGVRGQNNAETNALLRKQNELLEAILRKPNLSNGDIFNAAKTVYKGEATRRYGNSATYDPVWG